MCLIWKSWMFITNEVVCREFFARLIRRWMLQACFRVLFLCIEWEDNQKISSCKYVVWNNIFSGEDGTWCGLDKYWGIGRVYLCILYKDVYVILDLIGFIRFIPLNQTSNIFYENCCCFLRSFYSHFKFSSPMFWVQSGFMGFIHYWLQYLIQDINKSLKQNRTGVNWNKISF